MDPSGWNDAVYAPEESGLRGLPASECARAQPFSESSPVESTRGNSQDDPLLLIDGSLDLEAVKEEEGFHRRMPDLLVPADSRAFSSRRPGMPPLSAMRRR